MLVGDVLTFLGFCLGNVCIRGEFGLKSFESLLSFSEFSLEMCARFLGLCSRCELNGNSLDI